MDFPCAHFRFGCYQTSYCKNRVSEQGECCEYHLPKCHFGDCQETVKKFTDHCERHTHMFKCIEFECNAIVSTWGLYCSAHEHLCSECGINMIRHLHKCYATCAKPDCLIKDPCSKHYYVELEGKYEWCTAYDQKENKECCVCYENTELVVFFPCGSGRAVNAIGGHCCACATCSQKCNKCPLCRVSIATTKERHS